MTNVSMLMSRTTYKMAAKSLLFVLVRLKHFGTFRQLQGCRIRGVKVVMGEMDVARVKLTPF